MGTAFMGYNWLQENGKMPNVDPARYEEVFHGEVDCENLEDVFARFNFEYHPLYRGRSLSMSDVIVTEGGAFYCDMIGFRPISFDESQTHKPDGLLKIVYVEPGHAPFVSEIADDFRALQKAVDGPFEPIYMGDGTVLVCNDNGKLIGMEGNRRLGDSIIAGPFFMVGENGDNFRSLTDSEIDKYMEKFAEPEQISQQETQEDMGFTFYTL